VASLPRYRDADLIEPWDVSRIPEFANLSPQLLDSDLIKDELARGGHKYKGGRAFTLRHVKRITARF
jgi:spermidine/putrescine-binding protein